jgi:hypothetical protein
MTQLGTMMPHKEREESIPSSNPKRHRPDVGYLSPDGAVAAIRAGDTADAQTIPDQLR